MSNKPTICAVIVTFNRKALLTRTLEALYRQTCSVDKVLVIDNASTDGTANLLREQGYLIKENFEYQQLKTNTGGAGGFYTGVKTAFEQGYDWLWLMDDDGYPTDNCLQELLEYQMLFDFYGPLVLSDKDQSTLSFPITLPIRKKVIRSKQQFDDSQKILADVLIPFNGVLLNRSLVEKIGYPDEKFFIWGDDLEYTKRARQAGARIATIRNIEFYHPTAPDLGTPMLFGKMQFNNTDSKLKLYCLCRNNTYNLKKYHSPLHAFLFVGKTIWFYTFTKPSWRKLKFSLVALNHGWHSDFSHHRQYIGQSFE